MVPELEKARVLEFRVRMDCNGCVQRIKRAMHGIDGVYNVNIDLASQKLTVVGTADPDKIIKAIKKTRKIAIICSHTENNGPEQPPPPTEAAPSSDPPASDAANQPPAEPAKDDAPSQDNAVVQVEKPSPEAKDALPVPLKDVGEIPMVVHHYPHDCIQKGQWNYYYPQRHGAIPCHPPYYVIQSYNNYRSSPYPS
ncbi:heavy metal-associated isoprenylated plant protein 6 [Musa acuminata AAA Group]|uniref:heavy metal-associated isoprenylated plant protein 6 n=1 Tax=Musa acuminata AAA Group TaxID=214697 RepID=UPI0031D513B8